MRAAGAEDDEEEVEADAPAPAVVEEVRAAVGPPQVPRAKVVLVWE